MTPITPVARESLAHRTNKMIAIAWQFDYCKMHITASLLIQSIYG